MTDPYIARIVSYTEGKNPITMQGETPAILKRLIDGVSEKELKRSPAPGKWSVAEILAHLAESEIVTVWRYRQMIENSGGPLSAYDQEQWARMGKYASRDPQDSLRLFDGLRKVNLEMFARLTRDEWQSFGVHAERGKMTVETLARHIAGHDRNHVEQIQKILGKG